MFSRGDRPELSLRLDAESPISGTLVKHSRTNKRKNLIYLWQSDVFHFSPFNPPPLLSMWRLTSVGAGPGDPEENVLETLWGHLLRHLWWHHGTGSHSRLLSTLIFPLTINDFLFGILNECLVLISFGTRS